VSLTSQICKVFEAVIRDEIVKSLDKYKLIRDSQHSFRKGRSCVTNLLLFLDQILRCVDEGFCVEGNGNLRNAKMRKGILRNDVRNTL